MLDAIRLLRRTERGSSSIELIPLLLLFALLVNYMLGFFGVIHTGILNSIASRNYAFETFRNRSNLTYLRDIYTGPIQREIESKYTKSYRRYHGITSEFNSNNQQWVATKRPIRFTDLEMTNPGKATQAEHNTLVRTIQSQKKVSDIFTGQDPDDAKSGIDPVWIQTLYGICLNAECRKK